MNILNPDPIAGCGSNRDWKKKLGKDFFICFLSLSLNNTAQIMLMQILSHSKTDFLVAALQNLCIFLLIDVH